MAIRQRLEAALTVRDEHGGSEALADREIDPARIGEEIPGERVGNMVRQDRAELLRRQIDG